MNDNIANKILCPFYISHNSGRGNNITITCEKIENNMGFEIYNRLSFNNKQQRGDYMEIFCMDRYANCPYYRTIYSNKYKE